MTEIQGVVRAIIYRNEANGYTVLELADGSQTQTVVGTFPIVKEGDSLAFSGEYTEHSEYGRQFKAAACRPVLPEGTAAIERYLASGVVKGVGVVTARQIVRHFGERTLDILLETPQRLTELPGIGRKRAALITKSLAEAEQSRNIMMFLQQFDLTSSQVMKIYKAYGAATVTMVKQNPYRLIYTVPGIGFKVADRIAMQVGVARESQERLSAALVYVLKEAAGSAGHVYLPLEQLRSLCAQVLGASVQSPWLDQGIEEMIVTQKLIVKRYEQTDAVYLPYYFAAEGETAKRIAEQCAFEAEPLTDDVQEAIARFEKAHQIAFAPLQREAIAAALSHSVCVITGGPGTGKTTILNCLLSLFDDKKVQYVLCAPTGRAAKRMSEATGREAATLHRLLEYGSEEDSEPTFARDDENPLEAEAVIVDEASMVDLILMRALLRALPHDARLILVGDADQLMSVGAGDVLRDLIASGVVPVARLTENYRQGAGSAIITNAHRINRGETPDLSRRDSDFFFERKNTAADTLRSTLALVSTRLPSYFGFDSRTDIQVLTPMKKGETGVYHLNAQLQAVLNPPGPGKAERVSGAITLREGDKVMQVRNNYQMTWTRRQGALQTEGIGVYNGDIGFIESIDNQDGALKVRFDDGRVAEYDFSLLDDLDLAYAMSVHKSQGSEFTAVVLPLYAGPPMLMTRNLLYTAVTRAKKLVIIVGREQTVAAMVQNNRISARYGALCRRIGEYYGLMQPETAPREGGVS